MTNKIKFEYYDGKKWTSFLPDLEIEVPYPVEDSREVKNEYGVTVLKIKKARPGRMIRL